MLRKLLESQLKEVNVNDEITPIDKYEVDYFYKEDLNKKIKGCSIYKDNKIKIISVSPTKIIGVMEKLDLYVILDKLNLKEFEIYKGD